MEIEREIMDKYAQWSAMMKERDVARTFTEAMYWPEAVLMGQASEAIQRGTDEIASFYAPMMGGDQEVSFVIKAPAAKSDTLQAVMVEMIIKGADGQPDMHAPAMMAWERRGSEWKLIREVYYFGHAN